VSACGVRQGVAAWDASPDPDDAFDASGLGEHGAIWLRNSLGKDRAGYEILTWRREGGLLRVEVHFALGGDDGRGGTWTYSTRALSTHRLERGLPVVRTAFHEMGALRGDARLGDDGWRGERGGPDGTRVPLEEPDAGPFATAYSTTLLPLTMPLREGARLTFVSAGDGVPIPLGRDRLECVGRGPVQVDGRTVEAWTFAQRHYGLGTYGGDERFHVTDDRRLVRIDWGPNYADCWAEAVARDDLMDGVPEHVVLPDDL